MKKLNMQYKNRLLNSPFLQKKFSEISETFLIFINFFYINASSNKLKAECKIGLNSFNNYMHSRYSAVPDIYLEQIMAFHSLR
jgi:hypothetical protein